MKSMKLTFFTIGMSILGMLGVSSNTAYAKESDTEAFIRDNIVYDEGVPDEEGCSGEETAIYAYVPQVKIVE